MTGGATFTRSKQFMMTILPMVTLLMLSGLFISSMAQSARGFEKSHQTVLEAHSMPLVGQYLSLNGIEAVYQLPSPLDELQGVLFVAHGCSHSATDWWPKSSSCTKCVGLPIEMAIVREAIYAHRFAVIGISSTNRAHKCWSPKDVPRVQEALQYFYSNIIPGKNVSLHGLGASSGGGFVGFLSQQKLAIPLSSICVQISSVAGDRVGNMPPTLFVLMSRDEHTLSHVKGTANGIAKSNILVTSPKEIKPEFFSSRSGRFISVEESRTIQAALKNGNMLDDKLLLVEDPRGSNWREVRLFSLELKLLRCSHFDVDVDCEGRRSKPGRKRQSGG